MIRIQKSNTHVNGESVDTVEIWEKQGNETERLIIIVPVDKGEPVVCAGDQLICQAGKDGEAVVVLA